MDNLAKYLDQSILRPNELNENHIKAACQSAIKHGVRGVVVHPCNVKTIKKLLENTNILIISVCDFPHGKGLIKSRVKDIKEILSEGADEIDIVINYEYLLDNNYRELKKDLKACVKAIGDKVLKIILEVDYLSERQIKLATETVCKVNQEENKKLIIKTKTGFSEYMLSNKIAVKIIKKYLEINNMYGTEPGKIQIKASGGIKTREEAISLLEAGAHILGVSKIEELL